MSARVQFFIVILYVFGAFCLEIWLQVKTPGFTFKSSVFFLLIYLLLGGLLQLCLPAVRRKIFAGGRSLLQWLTGKS